MLGSMTANVPLNELGEFLKKRRSELSPRTVGLPETGKPRRVAGLRREEVAQLASISTDYYTRLEQGRMQASAPVLDVLAQVLHLDDDERGYLFQLAGKTTGRTRRRGQAEGPAAAAARPGRPHRHPGHRAGPPRGRPRLELAGRRTGHRLLPGPGKAPQLPADHLHGSGDAHPVRGLEDLGAHRRGTAADGSGEVSRGPSPDRAGRRTVHAGQAVRPMVGRSPGRRAHGGHEDPQPPGRRRTRPGLGHPHRQHRPRPAPDRLDGRTRLPHPRAAAHPRLLGRRPEPVGLLPFS